MDFNFRDVLGDEPYTITAPTIISNTVHRFADPTAKPKVRFQKPDGEWTRFYEPHEVKTTRCPETGMLKVILPFCCDP